MKLKHLFTHLTFTLFISIFFFGYTTFAQNMEDNKTELSVVKTADDIELKWGPCPPFITDGCNIAVLHGDPAINNVDILFKLSPNTNIQTIGIIQPNV